MPFAGLVVKEIVDLQFELMKKQTCKKNMTEKYDMCSMCNLMTEIINYNKHDMCLMCQSMALGDSETAWPSYAKSRHVVEYLKHLKVM